MLILRRIIVSLLCLPSLLMLCLWTLTFVPAIRVYDPTLYSGQDDYIGHAVHFSVAGVFGIAGNDIPKHGTIQLARGRHRCQ